MLIHLIAPAVTTLMIRVKTVQFYKLPFLNPRKGENDRRKYFMVNLHERMLPTSAGVELATSWSPVGRTIQLSHRGRHHWWNGDWSPTGCKEVIDSRKFTVPTSCPSIILSPAFKVFALWCVKIYIYIYIAFWLFCCKRSNCIYHIVNLHRNEFIHVVTFY